MSKEEIEKQLKLSKRQSKDERYDYLCSEFNAINYCINLEKYTNKLQQENQSLKKQLEYLRSGEYYNQLRFERDMLQYVADNGKVSKEDKEFIDMTHRNTELLEVIEEVREYINSKVISNGEIIDQLRKIEVKELLQILDKVKGE